MSVFTYVLHILYMYILKMKKKEETVEIKKMNIQKRG